MMTDNDKETTMTDDPNSTSLARSEGVTTTYDVGGVTTISIPKDGWSFEQTDGKLVATSVSLDEIVRLPLTSTEHEIVLDDKDERYVTLTMTPLEQPDEDANEDDDLIGTEPTA